MPPEGEVPDELLARFHDEREDQRGRLQRDRDRVHYSSAFSRLAGVTQVAAASEGYPFHNRLTHSLKVAQIARRVAEHLTQKLPELAKRASVDPDACEAAALSHDLGHPPFGHIAEDQLDKLVSDPETDETTPADPDGFEGNAQSFRIVARLAQRRDEFDGLNLTRLVLDATLKYPWLREDAAVAGRRYGSSKHRKFGAYRSDTEDFLWVRAHSTGDTRAVNASIMNWADDVAYAVHDVEDFYRSGQVPIDQLYWRQEERSAFLGWLSQKWANQRGGESPIPLDRWDLAVAALDRIVAELPFNRMTSPYAGTKSDRKKLRRATSYLIGRYLRACDLWEGDGSVEFTIAADEYRHEVELLKELVWYYVIDRPALRSLQIGQERIIIELFHALLEASRERSALLPVA